jgi:hypothetical protein
MQQLSGFRLFALRKLFEGRALVHGHVVSLVALDLILRLLLRGMNRIPLEYDLGGDLFLDRPPNSTRFRVPFNMISYFEVVYHRNHEGDITRPFCSTLFRFL